MITKEQYNTDQYVGKEVINTKDIMYYLPHRYPFLLIDRVVAFTMNESIVTLKNISYSDPVLQGHYPHYPIFPGAYILEAMAQSSALFVSLNQVQVDSNRFLLLKANNLKFRRGIIPGDTIYIKVTYASKRKIPPFKFNCLVMVNNTLASECELVCSVG